MNQLEILKKFTIISADSSDIELIRKYNPQDVTTNPSLILNSINSNSYQYILNDALKYAKKNGGNKKTQIINASDKLSVNIGTEILKIIPGRVSTELDARLSFNCHMCIEKAHKLISLYKEQGIHNSRILIKIASTWEGIKAAEELEKENINCNLTLLFSFAQAKACAESNVYLISPFIGRIYDWYNKEKQIKPYTVNKDPGIILLKKIFNYYKKYNYKTVIMGASFRKIEQIQALFGCDYLTISPKFLKKLHNSNKYIERKLIPFDKIYCKPKAISESEFRFEHNQDLMAVNNLAKGINKFSYDLESLENILMSKL